MGTKSTKVNRFLDDLNHPLRNEIEELRATILDAEPGLTETIKWNGPSYSFNNNDRITMRVHPPKQLQVIFHRGAKAMEQPEKKLIPDNSGLLVWKGNDRAIATFTNPQQIKTGKTSLTAIVKAWIHACG